MDHGNPRPVLKIVGIWSLNSAKKVIQAMTKAYKLAKRAIQVRVVLHVERNDRDLPSAEEAFALFSGVRRAYGRTVELLGLWAANHHRCVPDVGIEIAVDEKAEVSIEASFGIQLLHTSQRLLLRTNGASERALVTKVYPWHIDGERQYGDDPEPIEDRFLFVN
ncbi:hypothetical protein QFC20_007382 [Naganishia adeliensis]|uniref:Uncharacterized protein n=1 Tax=Naganishia adeliensis TaxID=92952 RepID=A0ACC2UZA3_9TREE|nr:hypothetical protein QFC20_007382 [Naganishia adeliensis]